MGKGIERHGFRRRMVPCVRNTTDIHKLMDKMYVEKKFENVSLLHFTSKANNF